MFQTKIGGILMQDVIIIGAGVVGCAVARELSKYDLKVTVIEKEIDVACGASKANSGIVHAGEDPVPGTLKAKMNVLGNSLFNELQKELDFPFKRNGSFVLCFDADKKDELVALKNRGIQNGVPSTSMHLLTREEALILEPHLSDQVTDVLYLETGGIVSPYEFTIALAENAATNGVTFRLGTKVMDIKKVEDTFKVFVGSEVLETRYVINAAGVFSDELNNKVSQITYHITPRRGEYVLCDKIADQYVQRTLFQLPTEKGKGILVTPTTHGNLLIGPNAQDLFVKGDVATSSMGLAEVLEKAKKSIGNVPSRDVITSFAGQRAHEAGGDFVIGEAADVPGFINALGIESPGLTSAPAIAIYIKEIIAKKETLKLNPNYNPYRKAITRFSEVNDSEKASLIHHNPLYSTIVCRCETVTEAEIREAIRRPVGATTLDGLKRRTRVGMGRCQCGFCMNRLVEILSEELQISLEEVCKSTEQSQLLVGDLKQLSAIEEENKGE